MTRHFLFTQWIQLKLQENMKSSIPLSLWYFFVVLTAKNILSEDSGSPWGNPIEFLETTLYTQYLEPNRFKPCFLSVCSCSQFFSNFLFPHLTIFSFCQLLLEFAACGQGYGTPHYLLKKVYISRKNMKKWKCYLAYL